MHGQLTFVTLPVADLAKATHFYESVFGWIADRRPAPAVFFKLPALTVALLDRAAFDRFTGGNPDRGSPANALCSWNLASAAEVNEMMTRAQATGATTRRQPAPLDWGGWAGIFETPDGHLWEIVWNPRHTIPPAENNL